MLKTKILQTFEKHSELRALFYFDSELEYEKVVEDMEIEGIRVIKYNHNPLELKIKLNKEWYDEKVFLYFPLKSPLTQEEMHSFPLLDLLLANRELKLDDITEFMAEYHLQPHHEVIVNKYINELKYAKVREVLSDILRPENFTAENVTQGLISSYLDFKKMTSWELIIGRLLELSKDDRQEQRLKFFKKISSNSLEPTLINQLRIRTGFPHNALNQDTLVDTVRRIKYNVMVMDIQNPKKEDPYRHLKIREPSLLSRLKYLHETCLIDIAAKQAYTDTINKVGQAIREEVLAGLYAIESEFSFYNRSLYIESIRKWLGFIREKPALCIEAFSRLSQWTDDNELRHLTWFLIRSAEVLERVKNTRSLIYDNPEEYAERYVNELYKTDRSYRNAISSYNQFDETHFTDLDLPVIKEDLEKVYFNFCDTINRHWLDSFKDTGFNLHKLKLPKQYDFYKNHVLESSQKIAVIISDALRFEAASELLSELHEDPKNEALMEYMIASLPSITALGMANMLPGENIEYRDSIINKNGMPAGSLKEREALLRSMREDSRAVPYNSIISLSQSALREVFKSHVTYIYHDTIDAIGDDRKTEKKTFGATREAINELKKLINQLHHTYNVSRVIVTADHGYLYNDMTIGEKEKENCDAPGKNDIHSRYILTDDESGPVPGYYIQLKNVSLLKDERWIIVPKGINRYKVQGSGQQYVHGGASLQEMIVPVLVSSRRRISIAEKVDPVLKQKEMKIISNMLRIQIVQKDPVSREKKERNLSIALYFGNQVVSNQAEILLGSTSDLPTERIYPVDLVLKPDSGDSEILLLKIFDKDDPLNPLIEEKVINTTIIKRDF